MENNNINNKFYITTPIYYASGKPHLGHAYTSIACDVLARWNRNLKKEVFFATGTDEHGQKIVQKAKKLNLSPKEFVDSLIPEFEKQLKELNILNDYFIRTTNKEHKEFVQEMLQICFDNGDIYKGKYEGLYCVDCERYYKEDELIDGKICPDHRKEVDFVKDENYFFRLSKYENDLLEFYKKNPNFLAPSSKALETINFVKNGLEDISISRHKSKLDWGIELPFDKEHVTYVWFDALFNYISLLKINKKEDFWPANVHVVGKDIMRFHKIFWPAFLISVKKDLPKKVFAHGWWTVDSQKMSKTIGNVIEPLEIAQKYGVDEFRYFLLSAGTFGDDQDFNFDLFFQRINNDLNNDLGNLVSRVHSMTSKYFNGIVPKLKDLTNYENELIKSLDFFKNFNNAMQNLQFNLAIDILFTKIRQTNAYINKVEPWKVEDKTRLAGIINTLNFAIKIFADYIDCFMPTIAKRIREQFNFKKGDFKEFKPILTEHKLGKKDNLFTKIVLNNENKKEKSQEKIKQDNLNNHQTEKKNNIKAIIFDFDGVIHNTFEILYNIHLKIGNNITQDKYKDYFNGNVLKKFENENEDTKNRIYEEQLKVYPDLKIEQIIKAQLEELKKKYDLFIISSNTEENLNNYFKNNKLEHIFKEILGSKTHKSKVEKFKMLFKKYNLNNKNTVFVTDTLGDILEANKVDIKTVAVDFGFHEKKRLEKGNPYKIVNKFKKIGKTIRKLDKELSLENSNFNDCDNNKNNDQENHLKSGFELLNLKVGQIVEILKVPDSDKLYQLKVDIGEENSRQILTGMQQIYSKDELLNKKVVVLANLKKAKMAGLESNGMVLACDNGENHSDCGVLLSDLGVGENIRCGDLIANNESKIKISKFGKVLMFGKGGQVFYNDKKLDNVRVDKNYEGKVC